jgi:hypothetical protein
MIFYDIVKWVVNIQSVAYDNYDIFNISTSYLVLLFWRLSNDKTNRRVRIYVCVHVEKWC